MTIRRNNKGGGRSLLSCTIFHPMHNKRSSGSIAHRPVVALLLVGAREKSPVSGFCNEASNHSIERTFQRPLRALWPAAHVKRYGSMYLTNVAHKCRMIRDGPD